MTSQDQRRQKSRGQDPKVSCPRISGFVDLAHEFPDLADEFQDRARKFRKFVTKNPEIVGTIRNPVGKIQKYRKFVGKKLLDLAHEYLPTNFRTKVSCPRISGSCPRVS